MHKKQFTTDSLMVLYAKTHSQKPSLPLLKEKEKKCLDVPIAFIRHRSAKRLVYEWYLLNKKLPSSTLVKIGIFTNKNKEELKPRYYVMVNFHEDVKQDLDYIMEKTGKTKTGAIRYALREEKFILRNLCRNSNVSVRSRNLFNNN